VLAALGTGGAVALAGCGGGSDGDTTDDGDNSDETDDGETNDGGGDTDYESTLSSDVEGLAIVSGEYTDTGISGRFPVTITVENTGSQEIQLDNYSYNYSIYDSGGSDLTGGTSAVSENPTVGVGDTGEVLVTVIVDGDVEAVASYEVTIVCGSFDEGAYCE
jgi:hypothetical protein